MAEVFFDDVAMGPKDPILGVAEAMRVCSNTLPFPLQIAL
jgi:hypothetical protein